MSIRNLFKTLFHFRDEEDYDEIVNVNIKHINERNEFKDRLKLYEEFEKNLPKIMSRNNSSLIDALVSKNGELVYILYNKVGKCIFILSPYIIHEATDHAINHFPHLFYAFDKEKNRISIIELHSDSGGRDFQTGLHFHENRGYGTILLKALINLAIQKGFDKNSEVTGMLSDVDAKDEKEKRRRNMFYHKRGFDVKPDLDADNGTVSSTIEQIDNILEKLNRR